MNPHLSTTAIREYQEQRGCSLKQAAEALLAGQDVGVGRTKNGAGRPVSAHHRPVVAKARVRARREVGRMNTTEQAYAAHLDLLIAAGEVVEYHFEDFGVRLEDRTFFYPDFLVQFADGTVEMHEVKAADRQGKPLVEDDALLKLKWAAQRYPFTFRMVWPVDKQWRERVWQS